MSGNGLVETQTDRRRNWGIPGGAPVDACPGVVLLAESLAGEFSAPLGILDPNLRTWRAIVGAPAHHFPSVDDQLLKVAGSGGLRLGRVALWRQEHDAGRVWLVLPLPNAEAADLLAFAGFRDSPENREAAAPSSAGHTVEQDDPLAWGPVCPDPALRAWGQQVVSRLQSSHETRVQPVDPTASRDAEGEHVVIGRLIRRMRIDDSPVRFQTLATNVLRTSLGMAAVAWVPSDGDEPVVVSGEIEGLRSSSFRTIISLSPGDSTCLANEPPREVSPPVPGVRRFASVPAGTAGWLLAVNPLDDRPIGASEVERMQYVASLIVSQSSNARTYAELKELFFGIIVALTRAIDAKDPYTSGHSERVARMADRLAKELGMPPHKRSNLFLAGLLHDIGKIGIDDLVLKKCGPLTPEEYKKIQAHVDIGVTILRDLKKLHHILPGVRHHHESLDGSGYPDHLSGEQIPLEARILAVADSFDAMSSDRHYRKRLTPTQIDKILQTGRGTRWDPRIVDALFACRMDLEAIRSKGLGESLVGAVNVTLGRQ